MFIFNSVPVVFIKVSFCMTADCSGLVTGIYLIWIWLFMEIIPIMYRWFEHLLCDCKAQMKNDKVKIHRRYG